MTTYWLQGGIDRTKSVTTERKARQQLSDFLQWYRVRIVRLKKKASGKSVTIATYIHDEGGWQ